MQSDPLAVLSEVLTQMIVAHRDSAEKIQTREMQQGVIIPMGASKQLVTIKGMIEALVERSIADRLVHVRDLVESLRDGSGSRLLNEAACRIYTSNDAC